MQWLMVFPAIFLFGSFTCGPVMAENPRAQKFTTFKEAEAMAGKQLPEEFRDGFCHGCDSGKVKAGNSFYSFNKDTSRFNSDKLYYLGWKAGFDRCRLAERNHQKKHDAGEHGDEDHHHEEHHHEAHHHGGGHGEHGHGEEIHIEFNEGFEDGLGQAGMDLSSGHGSDDFSGTQMNRGPLGGFGGVGGVGGLLNLP